MKFHFQIIPHTLLFREPAGTSRGIYRERKIWYLHLTTDEHPTALGIGECAPLPALSCDDLPNYEAILFQAMQRFAQSGTIDYETLRPYPSILMGIETAWLSYQGSLQHDPLHLFDSPFSKGEQGIPINGLVWMGTKQEMHARIAEKLRKGSRCVKLKIGAIGFEEELSLIRELRQQYDQATLEIRVDANGAFSPTEAMERLQALAPYQIHSIEQPIAAGQWGEMRKLCATSPLPIALDEELIGVNTLKEKCKLLDYIRPSYIVLKPSLHGGFFGAEEWLKEAHNRGIQCWITSALESNIGLNAIAQWTAHCYSHYYGTNYQQWICQGLGTGALYQNNFKGTRLSVEGDELWVEDEKQRLFRQSLHQFQAEWENTDSLIAVKTSGSTGTPQEIWVEKEYMKASAQMTAQFFHLTPQDRGLLCLPLEYIAGKMMAIRSWVVGFPLMITAPSTRPLQHLSSAPTFVAMTPLQVFETLQHEEDCEVLAKVHHLLIGGGRITAALSERLQAFVTNLPTDSAFAAWSSYGMTETLSHIALRRLCDSNSPEGYTALEGVMLTIDPRQRITIDAPHLSVHHLVTNDIGEWLPDGSLAVVGRVDNVICSGGVKYQIEEIEEKLQDSIVPFAITAVPDPRLGEAIVLAYVGENYEKAVKEICQARLTRYQQPKHFICIPEIPMTDTGKVARAALRAWVEHHLS